MCFSRETIRFTLAALKNAQIDKRAPLDPAEEMDVLKSQAKRRADSIEQFAKAGRTDLVAREQGHDLSCSGTCFRNSMTPRLPISCNA